MNDRIQSLIRTYADGSITPEEFDELQRILRADATLRERFLHELNIQAALDDVALAVGESTDGNAALDLVTRSSQESSLESPRRPQTEPPTSGHGDRRYPGKGENPRTRLARWFLAAAAVAVVALVASIYSLRPGGDQDGFCAPAPRRTGTEIASS